MSTKISSIIFISLFFTVPFLPIINKTFNVYPNYNIEKRDREEPPLISDVGINEFPDKFTNWYKENFSGRSYLYWVISNSIYSIFNSSIKQDKVIIGKNGFFFLGNSSGSVIDETIGIKKFSLSQLKTILHELERRHQYCEGLGIEYFLAVAPNKHSVYKDELPFEIDKSYSRLDDVTNFINNNSKIKVINLGSRFDLLKESKPLYYRANSHWTKIGGYYGYRSLINGLISSGYDKFRVMEESQFEWRTKDVDNGDLTKMLDLKVNESKSFPKPKVKLGTRNIINQSNGDRIKSFVNKNEKYSCVIFRDSYTNSMTDYLKHTFRKSTFVWNHSFNEVLIESEKPNMVIQIVVERDLDLFLK